MEEDPPHLKSIAETLGPDRVNTDDKEEGDPDSKKHC